MPTGILSALLIISSILLRKRTYAIKENEGDAAMADNLPSSIMKSDLYSTINTNTPDPYIPLPVASTMIKAVDFSSHKETILTKATPDMTPGIYSSIINAAILTKENISSTSSSINPGTQNIDNASQRELKLVYSKSTGNSAPSSLHFPQMTTWIRNLTNTGTTTLLLASPTKTSVEIPVMHMNSVNISDNSAITSTTNLDGINILLPLWLLITVVIIALGLLVIVGALLLHGWLRKKTGNQFHSVALNKTGFWSSPTQMYESQSRYQPINGATLECSYWDTPLSTFSTQRPDPTKIIKQPVTTSFYGGELEVVSNHSDEETDSGNQKKKEDGKYNEEKVARGEIEKLLKTKVITIT